MEVAIVLLIFLPVIYGEYEELQLIRQLTNYFHFDHHFFLLDSASDANQFISTDGLTSQTVFVWNEDKDLDDAVRFELKSKNCFMIVASQTTELEHTINLLQVIKKMQVRQKQMKVGIYFPRGSSLQDIVQLFKLCVGNHIKDAFAATYFAHDSDRCASHTSPLNIFTFHPFETALGLVNVTNSDKFDDYFQTTRPNFHQRELRYGGKIKDNLDGNIWSTVFDLMNASLVQVTHHFESTYDAFENGIDVIKFTFLPKDKGDLNVYPIRMKGYVILVPESLPQSELLAYLKNAISGEFCILSILSMVASIAVLVLLRYIKRKRILVLQSGADVFNLLLNDNGYIKYQKLFRAEMFLIVPLTFVGFILVNGILSNLKSHLTRPVLQPQINTAEEIYQSKVPILTESIAWRNKILELLANQKKYSDWDERVVVMQHRDSEIYRVYNRTNGIVIGSDMADCLLRTQKKLNTRGYHKSNIHISNLLFTYMVHRRFLFFERLNEIVQHLKSAGIYDLWLRREKAATENSILKYNLKNLQHQEATSVQRFEFPMFIVYGWFTGIVFFIFEIVWWKFKRN